MIGLREVGCPEISGQILLVRGRPVEWRCSWVVMWGLLRAERMSTRTVWIRGVRVIEIADWIGFMEVMVLVLDGRLATIGSVCWASMGRTGLLIAVVGLGVMRRKFVMARCHICGYLQCEW